ncbi:MAG: hypothetical protein AB1393_11745 [Candidatus Edwardsbacteria bacterium]
MKRVISKALMGTVMGIFLVVGVLTGNSLGAGVTSAVTFSADSLSFTKSLGYDVVTLNGCLFSTEDIGKPLLPVRVIRLLIPAAANVSGLTISSSTS